MSHERFHTNLAAIDDKGELASLPRENFTSLNYFPIPLFPHPGTSGVYEGLSGHLQVSG